MFNNKKKCVRTGWKMKELYNKNAFCEHRNEKRKNVRIKKMRKKNS